MSEQENMEKTVVPQNSSAQQREEKLRYMPEDPQVDTQSQVNIQQHGVVKCPYCGSENEEDASFCATCGRALRTSTCPHCGAVLDMDADFCEHCRHYVKSEVCSFCGAHMSEGDAYCQECGSPRGGIVCPVCNTLNDFSFCKQCGYPLTQQANAIVEELKHTPEYQQLASLTREYQNLDKAKPYKDELEKARYQVSDEIRNRVLSLLMQDEGIENPVVKENPDEQMSEDDLRKKKESLIMQLTGLLDKMQAPPTQNPAQARNYAMACKPTGVRTGWVCNYKHAVHSSPCACAKPQLGGKWIVLSKN